MNKQFIAKKGEDLACNFITNNGYKIIERNFRIRGGEIDIIAIDNQTLVYIEVKTRTNLRFGRPEESVNKRKFKFLERAAKFYKVNRKASNLPLHERIDVVSVDLTDQNRPQLSLIKNAEI